MRALRVVLRTLRFGLLAVIGLLALLFGLLQTSPGKRLLAESISGQSLKVTGLSGLVPTDLQVASIELLDSQGAWLRIEDAALRWSFASLFEGRVRVEILSAALVDVLRAPASDNTAASSSGGLSLPLGVDLQSLSIVALHVAPAVAEVDARWRIQGNGSLSADLHQGQVKLSADRTDGHEGELSADLHFDLAALNVDGSISLEEGRGGLLAGLLKRPDLEHVSAKLTAKGDARAGEGQIELAAGNAATVGGQAHWQPAGAGTGFSIHLQADGTELTKWGAPVAVVADGSVDDATIVLDRATVTASPLSLTAAGRYQRRADHLDLTASARSPAPGPLAPQVPDATWRDLELQAHAVLDKLTGQRQGSISFTGAAAELTVAALQDRLPPLGRVAFNGALALKADGSVGFDAFEVTSALAAIRATNGTFDPKTAAVAAKAAVDLPSLAPLSALAQRELTGRAHIDLDVRKDADGMKVGWQGTLSDVGAPGVPPGLVAREVTLSGNAGLGKDDRWSIADVKVASEAGTFGVSGQGQGSTGRFDLSLDLRQLSTIRPGLNGAITASSTIELKPDGGASGSLTAQGNAENQPLSLAGRFERDAAGGITVPSFQFHWASAALDVASLAVTPDRTTGSAKLQVARLQDIGSLLGTPLAGSLEAQVDTDPALAERRLKVQVRGQDLLSGGTGAAALQLDAMIDDPFGDIAADAKLAASGLRGVADLSRVDATVKGDRRAGFDVTLQAAGAQTSANLAGKVELPGEEIHLALSRLDARARGLPVSLAGPTRMVIAGQRVQINPTNLRLGGGRFTVQGTLDPQASNLRLELAALPLSLVDTFAPGTGLVGTAQARATVTGALGNPRVEATYSASGVRLNQPDAALLPSLSLQGTAGLAGGQATFDARLAAGAATNVAVRGKANTSPLAGSATITGALDLAPFAPLIGNQVRNVSGTLRPNLTVEIAGSRVTGSGTVELANAGLSLPESGMRLSGGSGRLVLQGEEIQVQRIAFQTAGNGSLTLSGTLRLVPPEGVAVDLAVASRQALLVSRPDLVAKVSSDLKIAGTTSGGIDVSGPINVDRADINIGAGQSASFPTLEVREINKPGAPPAAPGAASASPHGAAAAQASGGTPIRLALTVRAQAVFVRGRGLDAELGGSVKVDGSPSTPQVSGGLTMQRGDLNILGRRLVFSRGVVTLDNLDRIDPRLDFVASSVVNSTEVQVLVKGTAREPKIEITSIPPLPPDEALALLLFGKPSSALSAFELLQAAQGLAELTGAAGGGGTSFMGRLRQTLGLDQLRLASPDNSSSPNASNSPVSIEAGRYVAPGVYVGARQGAAGNSSRGVVEIQVLPHTKIEGDIGADSNGRVGAKMEWDY
ncbi:MAG: translocation/assembly module TamB domain-containing protein [Alphaproteobacteria bacterium]|nr:translocation/assembly module TamB domain-containing protein [Alphaproteobacteria bacterium]